MCYIQKRVTSQNTVRLRVKRVQSVVHVPSDYDRLPHALTRCALLCHISPRLQLTLQHLHSSISSNKGSNPKLRDKRKKKKKKTKKHKCGRLPRPFLPLKPCCVIKGYRTCPTNCVCTNRNRSRANLWFGMQLFVHTQINR